MTPSADADLIRRAQEGDTNAFRELVTLYQRFVFNVAFRFTGTTEEAEDVAQEVLVKMWRRLNTYRPGPKFSTWLYSIIAHQSLDYLKSASRKQRLRHRSVEEDEPIPDKASGWAASESEELLRAITSLARTLPGKQQAVFVLRDLEGMEVEEVCEALSLHATSVKSNLFHARTRMRELLTRYYQEAVKP